MTNAADCRRVAQRQGIDCQADAFIRREFLATHTLAILSVTRTCNLHCVYCRSQNDVHYDRLSSRESNPYLSKADWEKLVVLCRMHDVAEVLITGGEPGTFKQLKELVCFLHEASIRVAIHTNGTGTRVSSALEAFQKYCIPVNVHLSTELFLEDQRTLRGTNLQIDFLKRARQAGACVELKVILHQLLVPQMPVLRERLEWWVRQGASSIRFQPLVPGDQTPQPLILDRSYLPVLDLLCSIKRERSPLSAIIRNSEESFSVTRSILIGSDKYGQAASNCQISSKIIFITTDLEVQNCMTLWGKSPSSPCMEHFDLVCAGFQA